MDTKVKGQNPKVKGTSQKLKVLKHKKILITAGPTWVRIDDVRVISNTATGETGIILAEGLNNLGVEITLVLGPIQANYRNPKLHILRFKFFDELKNILEKELRNKNYALVIHSAAVADYKLKNQLRGKISSDARNLQLSLVPNPKLLDAFKKYNPLLKVVAFKFQPDAKKDKLLKAAKVLLKRSVADLVVANTISRNKYSAYLVNKKNVSGRFPKRDILARQLIREIERGLCKK